MKILCNCSGPHFRRPHDRVIHTFMHMPMHMSRDSLSDLAASPDGAAVYD